MILRIFRYWKLYLKLSPNALLSLIWTYPFLPYLILVVVKSPTLTGFATLILAFSIAVTLNVFFIRWGTYGVVDMAVHDYLYRFKNCRYIPYHIKEFVDSDIIKRTLFELDDPDDPVTRIQIITVRSPEHDPEATKTFEPITYSSPIGTSYIFLRDTPEMLSEASKFSLYHELGHASFANSQELIELIIRFRPHKLTLFLVAISMSWNIATAILFVVQLIIIFQLAPYFWHQREYSFRLRDEVRSDSFAIELLNQEECRLLLRQLRKYPELYKDKKLPPEYRETRRELLIENLQLKVALDSLGMMKIYRSTTLSKFQAFPNWIHVVSVSLFLFLAFFSPTPDTLVMAIYLIIAILVVASLKLLSTRYWQLREHMATWIRETNQRILVRDGIFVALGYVPEHLGSIE